MTYSQVWDGMRNQVHDELIRRDSDGAFIPFDEDNTDYQAFKHWLEDGNQPNPPTGIPEAPIAPIPPPDIHEVNAQVQDIDTRLSVLEDQVANVQEATQAFQKSLKT